ncbi:hypothetical protein VTO42DRAFT_8997 [Malbranchea cinnamomea]
MDHHDSTRHGLDGSAHSEYYHSIHPPFSLPAEDGFAPDLEEDLIIDHSIVPQPTTPLNNPNSPNQLHTNSAYINSSYTSWNNNPTMPTRPRGGSGPGSAPGHDLANPSEMSSLADRERRPPQRPPMPARTPSSTYDPPRRPPQFINVHSSSQLSLSGKRTARRDLNAQYRAQEKAYVQHMRQGLASEWVPFSSQGPLLDVEGESEPDEESPASETRLGSDPFDFEAHLYLEDEDVQPSFEDLQDPQIRERLEWHSMLASVLKGDVVRQEKQRLIGTADQMSKEALHKEIWFGVRARRFGRTIAMQKKIIEHGRAALPSLIEEIIGFEIKGEKEGGPALNQVEKIVKKIEACQGLYQSTRELEAANSRAASDEFRSSCNAIIAWHNTTLLINTQLTILKKWVGNDALDFSKKVDRPPTGPDLSDEGAFLDRLLKEEGLKSLTSDKGILSRLGEVINKAKSTLIENSEAFIKRHLPPYIEELLTLINFPSRLIQEVIRVRLSYAKKMKDPGQQSAILVEQMIVQFQILMRLAVEIKIRYLEISAPEPGWDLPPCVDENFDIVVVDALKFYFRLLNWKLTVNKNTFKEAEILEQEWDFLNMVGRHLEGGDIEVAEQFSGLAAKALQRLLHQFDREKIEKLEDDPVENEKRYRQILDSVRVRQRKIFRFSRFLRQRFENATEFHLTNLEAVMEALLASGHFLVMTPDVVGQKGVILIASPSLFNRPKDIQSILGTSIRAEDAPEDPTNPYILVLRPEKPVPWAGKRMQVNLLELPTDVRVGKLRLVADGTQQRLQNARQALTRLTGMEFDVSVERRANLGRVNLELNKIKKTAYKLSNTVIDSVDVIRRQNRGREHHELIQSCFAFATEFGKRSLMYMDASRRSLNHSRLVKLGLDWISFICDDCDAADRRTFKWAVAALEFAMVITHGQTLLSMADEDFVRLRLKVAGCMSLLISHFDIMGARSTLAAKAEKQRLDVAGGLRKLDLSRVLDDNEALAAVREQRMLRIAEIEEARTEQDAKKQALGKVLEGANETEQSLAVLSSSATNVTLRWQQGQYIGGGTSGSVYAAIDLDTGYLMAVKEIRLQDPSLIPGVAQQIRDEMGVLEVLDHPNIVSYKGIEVHRDKVYIFMEYCSGGSLATLLEHGRIEDETVIMVYTLQMLEGLAYLHQAGIVHRDIKPANILLDHNGVIKYVDFGAAMVIARQGKTLAAMDPYNPANQKEGGGGNKDQQHARRHQKSVTGTPMYMSPELVRGEIGHSAGRHGSMDIWSLGCVILEMVTGLRPWAGIDNEWAIMYKIAQGNQPHLPTTDQLSELGIDFLKRCFEIDPVKRPSAVELLQHEWIVTIRRQVVAEPQTPSSESSHTSSSTGSRQNSSMF